MTEQELTELAIKKAKGEAPEKTTKAATKTEATKAPETLQKNQLKLGNRIVTLKPWNGKTKKKFKKEFQFADSMEDVDFIRILNILVYDHTQEDYLFTDKELQYLLGELKIISISDEVSCESTCPACQATNKIHSKVTESAVYTPDTLPKDYKDYKFVNISKTEFDKTRDEIMNSEDYDGLTTEADIEVAAKIKYNNLTVEQMINHFDELSLKDIKELMTSYNKALADYKISETRTCKGCQTEQEFEIDIITGIFETLAE